MDHDYFCYPCIVWDWSIKLYSYKQTCTNQKSPLFGNLIYHECTKNNCHLDYPSSPKQNHVIWDHAKIPFFTKVVLITRYVFNQTSIVKSVTYQSYPGLQNANLLINITHPFLAKFFERLGFTLIICMNLKKVI